MYTYIVLQGKLDARKARRLAEERRHAEESAAKQYVSEQERQMKGVTAQAETGEFFKAPAFDVTESPEEKALRKEQVRCIIYWNCLVLNPLSC